MNLSRQSSEWRDRLERVGRVPFTLDGDEYEIPALPARAWVLAHLDDDPLAIFPGLLPEEDADLVLDAVEDEDDELDEQRCSDLGLDLLGVAAGWRWWEADRLIHVAIAGWPHLDGPAAQQGVDLLDLPLDRFCSVVYAWRLKHATEKDRDEFLRWLSAPPLNALGDPDDVSEEVLEDEAQSFLAVAGALGAG